MVSDYKNLSGFAMTTWIYIPAFYVVAAIFSVIILTCCAKAQVHVAMFWMFQACTKYARKYVNNVVPVTYVSAKKT